LVSRHSLAFADHAARFWLGVGGDARKALVLAEANLLARRSMDALELYAVAVSEAKEQGCKTMKDLLASGEGLASAMASRARTFVADCR
jgi:hypothetical protein